MYNITQDDYFDQKTPAASEELLNSIEVRCNPVQLQDYNDRIYKSSEAIVPSVSNKIIEVKYSEMPVVLYNIHVYVTGPDGALAIDEISGEITNETIGFTYVAYAWGVIITLLEWSVPYIVIVIGGYLLKVQGKVIQRSYDNVNILENGLLKYTLPDNHLIQSNALAKSIADTLLVTYENIRQNINIDWRGDPKLELNDEINCVIYNKHGITTTQDYYIYKQVIEYDGGVREKTMGKIIIV